MRKKQNKTYRKKRKTSKKKSIFIYPVGGYFKIRDTAFTAINCQRFECRWHLIYKPIQSYWTQLQSDFPFQKFLLTNRIQKFNNLSENFPIQRNAQRQTEMSATQSTFRVIIIFIFIFIDLRAATSSKQTTDIIEMQLHWHMWPLRSGFGIVIASFVNDLMVKINVAINGATLSRDMRCGEIVFS